MDPKTYKPRKRIEPEVVVTVNWIKPEDDPARWPIYREGVRGLIRKAMRMDVQSESQAECAD